MPFCLLLGPFAALYATVPRLFPVNRLPLYAISAQPAQGGGGATAEERKRGRLGKQSIYSCLFSRARPSLTSGGELCNVTGRAHFPVQSCCAHTHTRTPIPTEEQALLWRGRIRPKGCCEGISAKGVITRILVFHQHRIYTQTTLSSLGYCDKR